MNNNKLWAGRSQEQTDELLDFFNSSFSFDFQLWRQDIRGSIAHATMLAENKIIPLEDAEAIINGLNKIAEEIAADEEAWLNEHKGEEDIHMAVEKRLTELIGDAARKLHTARSRNDQVATDLRLWLREKSLQISQLLFELRTTFLSLAERDAAQLLPGYTHLQQAQPISLGHHWLAHYERFSRDYERLIETQKRINLNPLGSGALAGTTYPIDRFRTSELLGFEAPCRNSLDAVSDRDFVAEFQFVASLLMVHLSQLSEELILWSSEEFKFVELADRFATGSSMMPQKKNPDIPELIRGKSARVLGNLQGILVLLKGLPMAYNKDLQEDKEGLFDTCKNLEICLEIMIRFLKSLKINSSRMEEKTKNGFLNATDAADYLVKKQVSFRSAYQAVGKAVQYCLQNNRLLIDLSVGEWKTFHEVFENDIKDAIQIENCLQKRLSFGGTSPTRVREQITEAWAHIKHQAKTMKGQIFHESNDSGSRCGFPFSPNY